MEQARLQGAPIPEANHYAMLASADRTLLLSNIIAGIKTSLQESMSENEAQQLLTWYESDTGKQITAADEKGSVTRLSQDLSART